METDNLNAYLSAHLKWLKGKPGDRFRQWGKVFEITKLQRLTADLIALGYWWDEGWDEEADFRSFWRKIHPRLPWNRKVWLHWFERLTS